MSKTCSPIQGIQLYALQGACVPINSNLLIIMREYIKKTMKAWKAGKKYACFQPSMTLRDNVIYSYSTPIAYIANGVMHLNTEKYSATTSRQQSGLIYISGEYGLRVIECTEEELKNMIYA